MPNYQQNPIAFIDAFVTRNEKGQPFTLSTYQRKVLILAFTWTPGGQLLLGILLWSEIKKSGKTFLAACLGLWHAFVNPHTVVLVAANDMDQAVGRVFATMTALLDANEGLKHGVTIRVSEIRLSNGTTIRAVPNDLPRRSWRAAFVGHLRRTLGIRFRASAPACSMSSRSRRPNRTGGP